MYMLDGNYHFSIYYLDSPFMVSGFGYDKLNTVEIRALVILDAFRVMKVKGLLHMVDDPDFFSKFHGNSYTCFLSIFDNLIIFSL